MQAQKDLATRQDAEVQAMANYTHAQDLLRPGDGPHAGSESHLDGGGDGGAGAARIDHPDYAAGAAGAGGGEMRMIGRRSVQRRGAERMRGLSACGELRSDCGGWSLRGGGVRGADSAVYDSEAGGAVDPASLPGADSAGGAAE